MPGLEQHGQHAPPQVDGAHPLGDAHLHALGLLLVVAVALGESRAVEVVQLGHLVGREQGPLAVLGDALHEQVRHPVGRVHVMRAAAVVAGVLAQIEELLDVDVPGLQIGAHRPLALAALVDGNGRVIGHLQEWHHALALAVGALDVRAEAAHAAPVVAETAGVFGQQRIVLDRLEDAVEIVGHRGQEARRELRPEGAGIEQRRRRAHEIEGRDQVVEFDGARFAVDLADRQPHGDAHEESLRQLEANAARLQEIAVIERLQAQELELQVAFWLQRRGKPRQIEASEFGIEQFGLDAGRDIGREILAIALRHLGLASPARAPP